jgi:hypothetical protein
VLGHEGITGIIVPVGYCTAVLPVSNNPTPAISGTIDSILAEVPSSMIENKSVR